MGLAKFGTDLLMSGSAVISSILVVAFSGTGDTAGVTLELEDCLVIGGVVSLLPDNEDEPVESFLAIFAKATSLLDLAVRVKVVGDVWK